MFINLKTFPAIRVTLNYRINELHKKNIGLVVISKVIVSAFRYYNFFIITTCVKRNKSKICICHRHAI